jgi:hypothetical protein
MRLIVDYQGKSGSSAAAIARAGRLPIAAAYVHFLCSQSYSLLRALARIDTVSSALTSYC